MASSEKAIGLFGGTFDPVHIGHVAIAQSFLSSGFIDELWVVLTPDPPHKTDNKLSPYRLRKEMLQEAFKELDRVLICDIETQLPRPSYTLQTILHLEEKYSRYKFYLCIGEDSLISFKSWYKWEEILKHCRLLVAARPGPHTEPVSDDVLRFTHFIDHVPVEASSTELRGHLRKGEEVGHLVPKEVLSIIHKHKLYGEE